MRRCPFCKEKIQNDAVKCKHCGEFLTKQENIGIIVEYRFPSIWPGYVLGILFVIFEIGEAIISPQTANQEYSTWTILFWLIGLIYWCRCIYKLHKVIFKITDSHYPITSAQAVGYHFIPVYNLFWIFKWPSEILNLVNTRDKTRVLKLWVPGLLLFLSSIAGREVDGSVWYFGAFGVLSYLIRVIKRSLTVQPEPVPYKDKPTKLSTAVKVIPTCFILIAILALLVAIAIPNLLRARHNANESSAIATLREYHKMQEDYRKNNFSYGTVESFEKNGYTFTVSNVSPNTYTMTAVPIQPGTTGTRTFIVDETGVITSDGNMIDYIQQKIE